MYFGRAAGFQPAPSHGVSKRLVARMYFGRGACFQPAWSLAKLDIAP